MYNRAETTQVDSKLTVADILSSMANGEPITPSFADQNQPNFPVSGVSTGLTPILTPTTLASIEQTFVDLQTVAPSVNTNCQDYSRQSGGFVPPLIEPVPHPTMVKQEYANYTDDSSDSDWAPTARKGTKRSAGSTSPYGGSTTTTPKRRRGCDKDFPPEEAQKRGMRRERNKVAAAKCRQRRVDLTNKLIQETEGLEDEKNTLETEIQSLQQQKEQLEFLLEAHNPVCAAKKQHGAIIKREPTNNSRPSSLALQRPNTRNINVTEATGITISTPSNGLLANLGLDSMMDGHTGLTPITGAPTCSSEVHRSSSESSLNEGLASPTKLMAL